MPLINDILSVPHLDLGLSLDVERMVQEASSLTEFRQYSSTAPENKERYATYWSGVSLTSYDGELFSDMSEQRVQPARRCVPTAAAKTAPYLFSIVQSLRGSRARVMRIGPGGSLGFHCHHRDLGQRKETLTVQVPIVMPQGFMYHVRAGGQVHSQRYEPGRAYVFNSVFEHDVTNPSSEHRLTLMFYSELYNPIVRRLVQSALEAYEGPRIHGDVV